MANIDIGNILKSVEDQSKALAEKLFKQYTHQALSDVRDFLEKSKEALKSWVEDLVRGVLEFLELKDGCKFVDLSRLFVYYNERAIEGTVKQDSGAFLRDGIKSLAKQGVCPEQEWPYRIRDFTKKPAAKCYSDAKKHQITSYHRISTIEETRTCLADGYPFVFGFTV